MFRKSRAERAKAQAAEATKTAQHQLRDKVAPAVADAAVSAKDWAVPRAKDAAGAAKDWAGPKAKDARAWATPRVEHAIEAAAPRVEAAAERVSPAVDAARDKIVDDLLPRLVDAVNAAAAAGISAGSDAADEAKNRGGDAVAVLRGDKVAKKRHRGRNRFLLITAIAAAGAAAYSVLKRRGPQEDPWAIPPAYDTSAPVGSTPGSPATSEGSTDLATGDASDALGGAGNSVADPDVPGLTTDSAAASEAVEEPGDGSDAGKKQGDPLTDPLDEVEHSDRS